jgi:NAD dependent epimerase/dehydratase
MSKILVTGADGFIGSHLVDELVRSGHDVRAFVQYNSFGHRGWLDFAPAATQEAIEVVAGDIRDSLCVRGAMKGCDKVAHLAALIAIPYSYAAPESYVDTNIRGTLNVLQAARDLGTGRIIIISTSEVYGTAQFVPISEDHPLVAQSPYAATKIAADQLALSYYRSFETPVVVVRPFNTFGPRQSTRAVIPTIITQLLCGSHTINLGALDPRRDLTYVTETARGIIAALDATAGLGEVVNLGAGFDISVGELAGLLVGISGKSVEIRADDKRIRPDQSEVRQLLSDNRKALALWGWRPEVNGVDGLRNGLQRTFLWFSDPANLALYRHDQYQV